MRQLTILLDDDDSQSIDDVLALFAESPFHDVPEGESDDIGAVLGKVCREWMGMMFIVPPSEVSTCIGCGCTDNQACDGGCEWLAVDRVTKRGVCSSCEAHLAAFEAEQRVQDFRETLA